MARYSPRGGRSSRRGGRGTSSRGGRSSRSRSRDDYDDDYYDEQPAYYQKGARSSSHEQAGMLIFVGAILVVIITIIFVAAGGSKDTYERSMGLNRGGKYDQINKSESAARALGEARYFDQANPYEDKEVVAAKYKAVIDKYPGTVSAEEAQEMYNKVMDRRK